MMDKFSSYIATAFDDSLSITMRMRALKLYIDEVDKRIDTLNAMDLAQVQDWLNPILDARVNQLIQDAIGDISGVDINSLVSNEVAAQLGEQLDTINASITSINTGIITITQNITILQNGQSSITSQLTYLSGRISISENNITNMQSQLMSINNELTSMHAPKQFPLINIAAGGLANFATFNENYVNSISRSGASFTTPTISIAPDGVIALEKSSTTGATMLLKDWTPIDFMTGDKIVLSLYVYAANPFTFNAWIRSRVNMSDTTFTPQIFDSTQNATYDTPNSWKYVTLTININQVLQENANFYVLFLNNISNLNTQVIFARNIVSHIVPTDFNTTINRVNLDTLRLDANSTVSQIYQALPSSGTTADACIFSQVLYVNAIGASSNLNNSLPSLNTNGVNTNNGVLEMYKPPGGGGSVAGGYVRWIPINDPANTIYHARWSTTLQPWASISPTTLPVQPSMMVTPITTDDMVRT